ncbi:M48 family metallopeptidase [Dictyobacter kobayashii]|uniref:Peptidase M48 n=1 Tax=Dictyobacter kobayashii TaxID=2014872 RepID=A0A402AI88_9CHLR|nr:M48 family metalloprotease [Dictyobacter kobayashii]GCE18827.1 peptidase M48 [Dictyobacter kobayashii]
MQQINVERQQRLRAYRAARSTLVRLLGLPFAILLGSLVCIDPVHSISLIGLVASLWHRCMALFAWQPISNWYPVPVLLSYLLCMFCLEIIYLPLYCYIDYGLKRYHRIPTFSLRTCIWRHCRAQGRLVVKWAVLVQVIYVLCAELQEWWWCGFVCFQLLLDICWEQYKPHILARAYTLTPLADGELKQRLQLLMRRLSTSVRGIYILKKPGVKVAPNAFVIGWGWTRRIGIVHTMLERFSLDEIEVILAHELAHHIHFDIWRRILARAGVRTIAYYLIAMLMLGLVDIPIYLFDGLSDSATVPFILSLFVLSWLLTTTIINSYSRTMEYRADEFALRTTGLHMAFKSAMVRLANINEILAHEDSNSSHPSIVSRIRHAEEFAARHA